MEGFFEVHEIMFRLQLFDEKGGVNLHRDFDLNGACDNEFNTLKLMIMYLVED